jgi:tetratricopeptide (TPR) repeat protein
MLSGSMVWYAYALALRGDRDDAMFYANRGIDIAQKSQDQARIVTNILMRGTLYYHWGNLDEALVDLEQSKEMAEAINGEVQLVNILGTLGSTLLLRGEMERATQYLDLSLALAMKHRAAIGLPDFMARRAEIDLLNGKWQDALERAQGAMTLADKTRQTGIRMLVLRILGKIHAKAEQWDEAETHLKESIEKCEANDVQVFLAATRIELGRVYAARGKNNEARQQLDEAIKICKRIRMPYYLEQAEAARAVVV